MVRKEIGVANLVMGPYNWLYLKNKLMEWTDFLDTAGNSGKVKAISMILGWAWSKMNMVI